MFTITQSLAVIATLLAVVQGAPTSASTPLLAKRIGWADKCGASTFSRLLDQKNYPRIGDCQKMMDNLKNHGDRDVYTTAPTWKMIAWAGSCGFHARSTERDALVGNSDIYDLTRDAIDKVGRFGVVLATGYMYCDGAGVEWKIASV